jgi:hypothetical protein
MLAGQAGAGPSGSLSVRSGRPAPVAGGAGQGAILKLSLKTLSGS